MILDGKKLRDKKMLELEDKINDLKEKPTLAVVQIGDDPASDVYVRQKRNAALKLGITFKHFKLDKNIKEEEVAKIIDELNKREDINGLMIQLPIPKSMNEENLINLINPDKDVDGLTDINAGRIWKGKDGFIPCTPKGIITLLKEYNISFISKKVAMIGRSILVGRPMAALLLKENATVTICHSKTENLKDILLDSDIVIAAVGKPKMITKDMIKDKAVIVDVGINRTENGLIGDVDFDGIKDKASFITPVPGGVGPMTVCSLMQNTYEAYNKQKTLTKKPH